MRPWAGSAEFEGAVSVGEMRAFDAYTIRHFVSGRELMRRAAAGVYEALDWSGKRVAVVAGSGNNGGDGYALAVILAGRGVVVEVFRTSERFSEDGLFYYEQAVARGVPVRMFAEGMGFGGYDVVVDCILGTGFSGVPRGVAGAAIRAVNASGVFTVSVDINSGLNGDTGEGDLAVRSDLTVSIGLFKRGLFLGRGAELIGELVNVDIGIVRMGAP